MFCPYCSTQNRDKARFCSGCGRTLAEVPPGLTSLSGGLSSPMPLRTSLQATWLQSAPRELSAEGSAPTPSIPVTVALPKTSVPGSAAEGTRLEMDIPTLQEPITAPFVDQPPPPPLANEAFRLSQRPTRQLDQPEQNSSNTVGLHSKSPVEPLTTPLASRKPQLPTAGTQPLPPIPPSSTPGSGTASLIGQPPVPRSPKTSSEGTQPLPSTTTLTGPETGTASLVGHTPTEIFWPGSQIVPPKDATSQLTSNSIASAPPSNQETDYLGSRNNKEIPIAFPIGTAPVHPSNETQIDHAQFDPMVDTTQMRAPQTVQQRTPRSVTKPRAASEGGNAGRSGKTSGKHKKQLTEVPPQTPVSPYEPQPKGTASPTASSNQASTDEAENQVVQLPIPPEDPALRKGSPQYLVKFLESPPTSTLQEAPGPPASFETKPIAETAAPEMAGVPEPEASTEPTETRFKRTASALQSSGTTPLKSERPDAGTKPHSPGRTSELTSSSVPAGIPRSTIPASGGAYLPEKSPVRQKSGQVSRNQILALVGTVVGILAIGSLIVWWAVFSQPRPEPQPVRESTPVPSPTVSPLGQPSPPALPPDMVLIPAREYPIGRNKGNDPSLDTFETPQHRVSLKAFFLDKTEVTNQQYQEFIKQTGHKPPVQWSGGIFPAGTEQHPITGVSFEEAEAYARWAGKRLPTEEEWEAAAHGDQIRRYPWGDQFQVDRLNSAQSNLKQPTPVNSYPTGAGPFGNVDLAGNVWEWTASEALPYPGNTEKISNPTQEKLMVIRGGSFENKPPDCVTTYRNWVPAATRYKALGFRCARSL